jgi:hypothetical protein
MTTTFKDEHWQMQHLAREWAFVRAHNLRELPENEKLLFAEGALCVIAFERLLRILPAVESTQGDTLGDLLAKAHDAQVLRIVSADVKKAINKIVRVRDTTLHANYEQAAAQARLSVEA